MDAVGLAAHGPSSAAVWGVKGCGATSEKRTAGAEAHAVLVGFMPGMNPRPTARTSFSAAGYRHGDWRVRGDGHSY